MKRLEIYFSNLNEDTQKKVLEFFNYDSPDEGLLDYNPIFVLDKNPEGHDLPEESEFSGGETADSTGTDQTERILDDKEEEI